MHKINKYGGAALDVAVLAANAYLGSYGNYRSESGYGWKIEEGRDGQSYFTKITRRNAYGNEETSIRHYPTFLRMRQAYDSWRRPYYW